MKVVRRMRPDKSIHGLTLSQQEFVTHFTNASAPTYCDGAKSLRATKSYKVQEKYVHKMAYALLHNPKIMKTLKEMFDQLPVKEKIIKGIDHILSDPDHKKFIEAAQFTRESIGEKQPEQHIHVNLTQEERDRRYFEILNKVRGVQAESQEIAGGRDESSESVLLPERTGDRPSEVDNG